MSGNTMDRGTMDPGDKSSAQIRQSLIGLHSTVPNIPLMNIANCRINLQDGGLAISEW